MIVYTVVCRARDAAVLVEMSTEALTGNVPQVTTGLLEHLRDHPAAMREGDLKTYVHRNDGQEDIFNTFMNACTITFNTAEELDLGDVEEHYFHIWYAEGVFYCCLSDDRKEREQKINFAFLQAVAKEFSAKYTKRKIKTCNAYTMEKEFSPLLRTKMHHYNVNRKMLGTDPKVNQLMAQVEDMKTALGRNVRLLLKRGENVDTLLELSEQAMADAGVFKRNSETLRRTMRRKNMKMIAIMVLALLLASTLLALVLK